MYYGTIAAYCIDPMNIIFVTTDGVMHPLSVGTTYLPVAIYWEKDSILEKLGSKEYAMRVDNEAIALSALSNREKIILFAEDFPFSGLSASIPLLGDGRIIMTG